MSPLPFLRRLQRVGRSPLVLLAIGAAQAQAPQPASAAAPRLQFESVFSGYKPFTDEPVAPWRQTNDTVRGVGGWRSYAREAQQAQRDGAAAPASAASAPPPREHSQHGGKP